MLFFTFSFMHYTIDLFMYILIDLTIRYLWPIYSQSKSKHYLSVKKSNYSELNVMELDF